MTTLKRNGSDYSATIVGALVRSSRITIWTDVDGVFSADPRKVCCPSARPASCLHQVALGMNPADAAPHKQPTGGGTKVSLLLG